MTDLAVGTKAVGDRVDLREVRLDEGDCFVEPVSVGDGHLDCGAPQRPLAAARSSAHDPLVVPCAELLPVELLICGVCVVVAEPPKELLVELLPEGLLEPVDEPELVVVEVLVLAELCEVGVWAVPVDADAVAVSVETAIQPASPTVAALALAITARLHWRLRATSRSG